MTRRAVSSVFSISGRSEVSRRREGSRFEWGLGSEGEMPRLMLDEGVLRAFGITGGSTSAGPRPFSNNGRGPASMCETC